MGLRQPGFSRVGFRRMASVAIAGAISAAQASWPVANVRWYAVDGTNGSDSNSGFSDVSSAAAGLSAVKTLAGLGAVLPRIGANRKVVIIIAAGTYTDGLQAFLAGLSGYAATFPIVVGTVTNATSGAVAFSGSVADKIQAGFVTSTGMNAPGYNPVAPFSQTDLKCLTVAAGAPGFPSEATCPIPMGHRIRFDANTTTAALRNVAVNIIGISASDTLTLPNVVTGAGGLPAVPVGTDTFYIEMPGVIVGATFLAGSKSEGNQSVSQYFGAIQLVGISFTVTMEFQAGTFRLAGCSASVGIAARIGSFVQLAFNYNDETGTLRQVGSMLRTTGGGSSLTMNTVAGNDENTAMIAAGTVSILGGIQFHLSNGSFVLNGLQLLNLHGDVTTGNPVAPSANSTIGARSANNQSPLRVRGVSGNATGSSAGVFIFGCQITLNRMDVASAGAFPAITVCGSNTIVVSTTLTGSAGNTDVGLDLTNSRNSVIMMWGLPTLTGTLGDVRLQDGTIITWATAAAGVVDVGGNILFSNSTPTYPLKATVVAPGAVAVTINNAPAGSPAAPARYMKVADQQGGFFTLPSLT